MDTKICGKCNNLKPFDDFYAQKDSKDGKRSLCKICIKAGVKDYKKRHRTVYVPKTEYSVEKVPVEPKSPQPYNTTWLKRLYNITPEVYQKMLKKSRGVCPICNIKFDTTKRSTTPCVDHDHACCPGTKTCGKCLRGLICFKCNMGLGFFEDNCLYLKAATDYLTHRSIV